MEDQTVTRRQFLATLAPGTSSNTLPEQRTGSSIEQDEFVSLFDGKTLQGWHEGIQNGNGAKWGVEDGVLTGQQDPPGSGNGGILMTDREYGDFELVIDLAPDWGIDSGVFLRTNSRGECFQVYVDYRENGNIGYISTVPPVIEDRIFIRPYAIYPKKNGRGRLTGFTTKPDRRDIAWAPDYLEYSAPPEEWMAAWKVGQWNTLRIRCVGKYPRITTWINYTKIAEFDGASCPHPRYDRKQMFQALGRKGAIGLQVHRGTEIWKKGARCRWDNIRIRSLE